ncbi:MAG: PhoX family protein [Actinobacteria bacterium]|nr:PhoX family protein [Actinomycetota bacterium]
MSDVDRRTFLKQGAAAAGAGLLAGPFQGFFASAAHADPRGRRRLGYGPLAPVPDLRDGVERLLLPRGFHYRSFGPTGATLTDGTTIPGRHDGMAAFRHDTRPVRRGRRRGRAVLVRNHEVNGPVGAFGDLASAYDEAAGGGTTTVVVDGRGNVERSFVSLNGTQMNCSGGPMPWGSWITCEETVNGPDVGDDFTGQDNSLLTQKHGYIFEVPAGGQGRREPIRNAGRFAHEAAEYDKRTNALYLTEDNFGFASGFYRYLPPTSPLRTGHLDDGGRLQMLAVAGEPNLDLSGVTAPAPEVGSSYPVRWVDIDDPDPDVDGFTNDEAIVAVGDQGRAKGAAIFARLEGAAMHGPVVYFASTQGGQALPGEEDPSGFGQGFGQIWAYHTTRERLFLLFESPSREVLDFPDNIATSRTGTLVICEDGDEGNYLRGLTRQGSIFDFAKNNIEGRTDDEFAGATFSPDYETLYVNIQASNGLTFAIWGPWGGGGF